MAASNNNIELDEIALRKIFSYVPTKVLKNLSMMNKKWNLLAKLELKKRKIFLCESYVSGNGIIEKADFIAEYEKILRPFRFVKPNVMLCFLSPDFFRVESVIHENGIPLMQTELRDINCLPIYKCRMILLSTGKLISKLIPPNIRSLYVVAHSVFDSNFVEHISSTRQKNQSQQRNLPYTPVKHAISSLVFPNDVHSYRFQTKYILNQSETLLNIQDENSLKIFLGAGQDETLRLVMFYCEDSPPYDETVLKPFRKVLRKIKKNSKHLIVSGFHVSQVVSSTERLELEKIQFQIGFIALFSKNDTINDVKIAQMLIPGPNDEDPTNIYHPDHPDYPEKYHFRLKLDMLKRTEIYSSLDQNYVFAIVNKGLGITCEEGSIDDELVEFRRTFPNIPILAIKSKDKMAHDHFPGIDQVLPTRTNHINYDATFYNDLTYMNSAVYTIISLKKFE